MAQKQVTPEGIRKPTFSNIAYSIEMGLSRRHFEVWHGNHTNTAVSAIWRNEVGPVTAAGQCKRI
jgi:hypothetical protein